MQDISQPKMDIYNYSHTPSPRRPPCDYEIHSIDDNDTLKASINEVPATPSAFGRYAAGRQHSSMDHIIHNSPMVDESPERMIRRKPLTDTRMDHTTEFTQQDDGQSGYGEPLQHIKNAENYAPSEPANDIPDSIECHFKKVKGPLIGTRVAD